MVKKSESTKKSGQDRQPVCKRVDRSLHELPADQAKAAFEANVRMGFCDPKGRVHERRYR